MDVSSCLPTFIILDQCVNEGEEYLLYQYPRPSIAQGDAFRDSVHITDIRGVLSSTPNVCHSVSKEIMTTAVISQSFNPSTAMHTPLHIKFTALDVKEAMFVMLLPGDAPDMFVVTLMQYLLNAYRFKFGALVCSELRKKPTESSALMPPKPPPRRSKKLVYDNNEKQAHRLDVVEMLSMGTPLAKTLDSFFSAYLQRFFTPGNTLDNSRLWEMMISQQLGVTCYQMSEELDERLCQTLQPLNKSVPMVTQAIAQNVPTSSEVFMSVPHHNRFTEAFVESRESLCPLVGVCIFYRGSVIHTQLMASDLRDVTEFCAHHDLLNTSIHSPFTTNTYTVYSCRNGTTNVCPTESLVQERHLTTCSLGHVLVCALMLTRTTHIEGIVDPYYALSLRDVVMSLSEPKLLMAVDQHIQQACALVTSPSTVMSTLSEQQNEVLHRIRRSFQGIQITLPMMRRVTQGPLNVLMHFVDFNQASGIVLSDEGLGHSEWRWLRNEFLNVCTRIRRTFNRVRERHIQQNNASSGDDLMDEMDQIHEVGYRISCQNTLRHQSLQYWVVGKLYRMDAGNYVDSDDRIYQSRRVDTVKFREIYLCIHDSIPQDVSEVAFNLMYAIH